MNIIVAGLPGSGNNLVVEHLRRCGADLVFVDHGHSRSVNAIERYGIDLLVIPYRIDELARRRSVMRRAPEWLEDEYDKILSCRVAVREMMGRVPWATISYEEIVATGGEALNDMIRRINRPDLTPTPFPSRETVPPKHGRVRDETELMELRTSGWDGRN